MESFEGMASIGATLGRFGTARLRQKFEEEDKFDYARAKTAWLKAKVEADNAFENDPDYATYGPRYSERLKTAREEAAALIRSNVAREYFTLETEQDEALGLEAVGLKARAKEVDVGRGLTLEGLDSLRRMALAATDETTRQSLIETAQTAITAAQARGYYGAEEAVEARMKFLDDYAEDWVGMQPIEDQVELLTSGAKTGTAVDFLSPEKRAEMLQTAKDNELTAILQRLSLEDRRDARAEAELKKIGDDTARQGYALYDSGGLTREWIDANRSVLSPTELEGFYRLVREGPAKADYEPAIVELEAALSDGEDISWMALQYLTGGMLTRETYIGYMSKNRSAMADTQPSSPYKSGREFIRMALDPGLLSGAAQSIYRTGQARALLEFDNWAAANPGASRVDAIAQADAIVKAFQVVSTDKIAIGTGLPKFYGGTRKDMTSEDLDTAEDQVLAAVDSGAMTEEQGAQELAKIEAWRFILSQAAK